MSIGMAIRIGIGVLVLSLLAWGLRVDHLRGSYKLKLIQVTGTLREVTQAFNGFRAEIVDVTNDALARDRAHAADVLARNDAVSREVVRGYKARIDDARARYERLRAQGSAAGGGGGEDADLPGTGAAASGADGAPAQDGLHAPLSLADALICTEQAVQLDELIGWVERTRQSASEAAPDLPGQDKQ